MNMLVGKKTCTGMHGETYTKHNAEIYEKVEVALSVPIVDIRVGF